MVRALPYGRTPRALTLRSARLSDARIDAAGAARLGAGEVSLLVAWVLLLGGREILEQAKTPYDRRLPVVGPGATGTCQQSRVGGLRSFIGDSVCSFSDIAAMT
jgi:hypothetical protein